MQNESVKLFLEQLEDTLQVFPNLKSETDSNGMAFLKGILDISDDHGLVQNSFLIEIHYKRGFPYRFPTLSEIGGTIPNEPDWHKYSDCSCCITVHPDEIIKCKNGISIIDFIRKFAIPFFANYLYRIEKGFYLNGEYAHGAPGLAQFYEVLLKTKNIHLWILYCKYAFSISKTPCQRNDYCFCGSKLRFKDCHLIVFNKMHSIGKEQIFNDLKLFNT